MQGPEKPTEPKYAEVRRALDYSVIGLVFPVALVVGWFLGRTVGFWFGHPDGGGLIGGGLGVLAGFYNLYIMVQKLDREDRRSGGGS